MSRKKVFETRVNVSMTRDLWKALVYCASKRGMSLQDFIRLALWAQCEPDGETTDNP